MNLLKRLWQAAPGWLAWLETVTGTVLFMALLYHLREELTANLVGQGVFFITPFASAWCALRWRGASRRPWLERLALVLSLSLVLAGFFVYAVKALRLEAFLDTATFNRTVMQVLLLSVGPLFLILRGLLVLWARWNRLRRQRLRWTILHGHLLMGLGVLALWALVFGLMASRSASRIFPGLSLASSLVVRLLTLVFPVFGMVAVFGIVLIVVLLLPLAFAADRISRPLVARVEALARAVRAFRRGDRSVRLPETGQDEIAGLEADFNTMASTLDQALRDLSQERDRVTGLLEDRRALLARISHELRTPLATLSAHLEAAQAESLLPKDRLAVLENEVKRLGHLTDDLFTLAQAETRHLEIQNRSTDLGSLVLRQAEALKPYAWRAGRVTLVAEVAESLPPILADARRVEQILANLVRNAVAHTPPGGLVKISAALSDTHGILAVSDTGAGIPSESLSRIWEPFWRGTAETTPGSGLGLALVKELAGAMGGSVEAESQPGEGSRFTVKLPLAPPSAPF